METRVVVIGIGGGTCSGKTTLAKQLNRVLPNCSLLNQDRYCIHEKNLPIHPIHKVPDPDEAETAIDWPGFRTGFEQLVKHGRAQEMTFNIVDVGSSSSFGYLPQPVLDRWRDKFVKIHDQWLTRGICIEWRLVEGFIVFYDSELTDAMDVKLFIRTPGRIMEARREFRVFDNGDGTFWTCPPNYWENIAYPAYIRAHAPLFEGGDVERGDCLLPDMVVIEGVSNGDVVPFEQVFSSAAEVVVAKCQGDLV